MIVPPSIDPTGARDVTVELAAFLNAAPDGSRIDLPDNALYRCDGTVNIGTIGKPETFKNGLDIRGNGATIFTDLIGDISTPAAAALTKNRSHLVFQGGGSHTLTRLKIRGANTKGGRDGLFDLAREGQHCLQTFGVHKICITGCEFSMPFGDCIYLNGRKVGASGTPNSKDWTSDVWIYNCDIHHSGRQGITLQGVRDTVITRNRIYELRRSTFEFEPMLSANNGATGIHITDNDIGAGRMNVIANHGTGPVNDIWFEGNRLTRPINVTVIDDAGARRSGWHILNNVGAGLGASPWYSVMEFTNVDGVEVTGNSQAMKPNRSSALVNVKGCTGVAVTANKLVGALKEVRYLAPDGRETDAAGVLLPGGVTVTE